MKSFTSPLTKKTQFQRPDDCTCGDAFYLAYEPAVDDGHGRRWDVADWHADDCGYWGTHIAREDLRLTR